jgi:nicotinamidase/pyrazinamidase
LSEKDTHGAPRFHDATRIGTLFHPDMAAIGAQAARAGLPQAHADELKVHLLVVDMQVDFCHPTGALFVPGAQDDLRRLIRFIYRRAGRITDITCSLDSHLPLQIFHPAWWADSTGAHPPPFTIIRHDDVIDGKWTPLFEPEWSVRYTGSLQRQGRNDLTIWPYHCLIGSAGHLLDPELLSAVLWHSLARGSQPHWWMKGSIPKTEHYSILQPEIPVPEHPQGTRSRDLLDLLEASDYIFIAGEARSHCVLETVEDLVEGFADRPQILDRIYVLQDCTSSIRHPAIDYESITDRRFADLERNGIHLVNSTDPLPLQLVRDREPAATGKGD